VTRQLRNCALIGGRFKRSLLSWKCTDGLWAHLASYSVNWVLWALFLLWSS